MSKGQNVVVAVYRQIAIDIAKDIANGTYIEGQKLFGRSVLSSQYKVSPETIRKAMHLLKDVGILEIEKGSGIQIKSILRAQEFVKRYNEVMDLSIAKNELVTWAGKQMKETADMLKKVQFLVDTSERLKNLNPFTPFEIKITSDTLVIGKTVAEVQFWHNTGGTVIAIRRGENTIISPGPHATFDVDDIFYIIGNDHVYAASKKFLFG